MEINEFIRERSVVDGFPTLHGDRQRLPFADEDCIKCRLGGG